MKWWWWEKRRARKAEERAKETRVAEAIAEHIAVRRPVGRAPRRPVVKPIERRYGDSPSLPSAEVSWPTIDLTPVSIDPAPVADPAPSTIDPGGGSSGGGGADGAY